MGQSSNVHSYVQSYLNSSSQAQKASSGYNRAKHRTSQVLDYYIQAVSNLSTNKLISRRKRYQSSPSKRIVNQIEDFHTAESRSSLTKSLPQKEVRNCYGSHSFSHFLI